MEVLWDKGNFMLLLKTFQDAPGFNELLSYCEKVSEELDGRKQYHLVVRTLTRKLRLFQENNLIRREQLSERIGKKFTRYSLTDEGTALVKQISGLLPGNVKSTRVRPPSNDLEVLWDKGNFMILLILASGSMSFNELLYGRHEHGGRNFAGSTLSRKLRNLIHKGLIQRKLLKRNDEKRGGKSTKKEKEVKRGKRSTEYSLTREGRAVLTHVAGRLNKPLFKPPSMLSTKRPTPARHVPEEKPIAKEVTNKMESFKISLKEKLGDVHSRDFFEGLDDPIEEIIIRIENELNKSEVDFQKPKQKQEFAHQLANALMKELLGREHQRGSPETIIDNHIDEFADNIQFKDLDKKD